MRFIFCFTLLVSLVSVAELNAGERGGNASGLQAQARERGVFRLVQQRRPRPDNRPGRRAREPMPPRLLERLRRLPPKEQEKVLRNNERFQRLPKERKEQLLERLHRFQALSPEQRERIEQRYENFRRLTPDQRRRAREIYSQHWRGLPAERRQAVIQEFRRLQRMSPAERKTYIARPGFQRRFNSEERKLLNDLSALPVGGPRPRRR